jgi:TrkA domain protein
LEIKKEKLYSIGNKYTIKLETGETLEIIDFLNGKKELFLLENEKIKGFLALTEEEAKEIGLILADLKEIEEKVDLKDKIMLDWFLIKKNFKCIGKKIKELEVRKKTGATIIAIERKNELITDITPEETFKENDKILLMGSLLSIEKAKKLLRG